MALIKGIGGFLNDLTGVTSSSSQAFRQSRALSNLSFEQEKYFAENAHQLEAQDLAKAGYNPALTATNSSASSIASSGGTGNAGFTGTSAGLNPLQLIDAFNSTRATSAQTKLQEAEGEAVKYQGLSNLANAIGKMIENKYMDQSQKTQLKLLQANITKTLEETSNVKMDWGIKQAQYENLSLDSERKMWENMKVKSDIEFYNKFGITKDQAYDLLTRRHK